MLILTLTSSLSAAAFVTSNLAFAKKHGDSSSGGSSGSENGGGGATNVGTDNTNGGGSTSNAKPTQSTEENNPSTSSSSTQQSTCPDASSPDANGNCSQTSLGQAQQQQQQQQTGNNGGNNNVNQPLAASSGGGGGGETINCLPGQEANSDLGTCQDPICGPGEQRDPSGLTRACVPISCPPGESFNSDINQCVINNPPPVPKCPDGSLGLVHQTSNGIKVVQCPNSPPQEPQPGHFKPPIAGNSGLLNAGGGGGGGELPSNNNNNNQAQTGPGTCPPDRSQPLCKQ